MAKARLFRGDVSGAQSLLAEHIVEHPRDLVAIELLAEIYVQVRQYTQAAELALSTPVETAGRDRLLVRTARRLYEAAQGEEAERLLRQALATDAGTARPMGADLLLARVLDSLDCSREAIPYYERAVSVQPMNSALLTEFADVLEYVGDARAASDVLRRILLFEPDSGPCHQRLGATLLNHHDDAAAEAHLVKARDLLPNCFWPRVFLSSLYLQQCRGDDALREVLAAVRLAHTDAVPHYQLGRVYSQLGRQAEATAAFRCAAELDPDDEDVADELRRLTKRSNTRT